MKAKRHFSLVLTTILAIGAMGALAWAAPHNQKPTTECSLIGTWTGWADSSTNPSMLWSADQTAGSTNADGQMLVNWAGVSSNLLTMGGKYAAVELTPGHGVWQLVSTGVYNYTWYAYGIDTYGIPEFSVMVAGVATLTDCNTVQIRYYYGAFNGIVSPQDMYQAMNQVMSGTTPTTQPVYTTSGPAGETRVPLLVVPSQ